jgi:hypothetical protein
VLIGDPDVLAARARALGLAIKIKAIGEVAAAPLCSAVRSP